MIKKLMRKIYTRKMMRHILKGERLQLELSKWGCDGVRCEICKRFYNQTCGMYHSMNKWNQKLLKLYDKYEKYECPQAPPEQPERNEIINNLRIEGDKLNES